MPKTTIICVDDEEIVLTTLKEQLKVHFESDFSIEVAESGEEALELLDQLNQDKIEVPLVISDHIMPGIKGDELLRRIHSLLPKTLKILLTGQADIDSIGNAVNYANLYRYISKPWNQDDLILTVREAVLAFSKDKQLEEQNKKLQKAVENLKKANTLKDEFLSNTSHELRTPLNGIIGITQSIIDGATGELSEETKKNLEMVVMSGKRLANLVNDILDYSKLKNKDLQLKKRAIDIRQLTEIVLFLLKPLTLAKHLELKNEIPNDMVAVIGDENRLQQILFNLIGNAIKFTEKGEILISAKIKDGKVQVSVADTGIGIPKNKFKDIFKSFEQVDGSISREYGGTGLGLTITKSLIELHEGEISVNSELGKGSVFSFTLQMSDEKFEDQSNTIEKVTWLPDVIERKKILKVRRENLIDNDLKDIRVLAVDDDLVNLQVLRNYLSMAGMVVETAHSGLEALEKLNKIRPGLILLDVMMPKMNGYEVCRKIREKYPISDLPVILITAKNQVSALVEGLKSGANDYIAKPFSKNELLARINIHNQLAKINIATGRFVPRDLLKLLQKDSITSLKLGDQIKKEMTILFADIRSFTTRAESMTPEENFAFLNGYLEKIGPVIRENNGFIDKYIGDAIMALFPYAAEDAIRAALSIKYKLSEFNDTLKISGKEPVCIGIGIHTGMLMLGTIGEHERMEGTVISDAVNLASRLEGLTKLYGATTIISDDTLVRLTDPTKYNFRFLEKVKVKGKEVVVSIFEFYDTDSDEIKIRKQKSKSDFEQGIQYYYSKDFENALKCFKEIINFNPEDKAVARYLERANYFRKYGFAPDWDGTEILDSK
ncbi:MAG: response regulator [Desulfobacterales bacterium]|nr:response regulator [Desulfobacterales bacterium]MBF0396831.1 response regulator [Desulfobacterales bacterium]